MFIARSFSGTFWFIWLSELWIKMGSVHQHVVKRSELFVCYISFCSVYHLTVASWTDTALQNSLVLNLYPSNLKTMQLKWNYSQRAFQLKAIKIAASEHADMRKSVYFRRTMPESCTDCGPEVMGLRDLFLLLYFRWANKGGSNKRFQK